MLCKVELVCWVVPGAVVPPPALCVVEVCSSVLVGVAGDVAGWVLVGFDVVAGRLEIVVVLVANIAPP